MPDMDILEERVRFAGDGGALSGVLAYPADGEPAGAVLVCPPHPNFAGTMENNVVRALSRAAAGRYVTLRFDYRGVGESGMALPAGVSAFDYWERVESQRDYADAVLDVAAAARELARLAAGLPMALVGYSFGAVVGLRHACRAGGFRALVGISPPVMKVSLDDLPGCPAPCLLMGGDDGFACSGEKLLLLAGPGVTVEVLESRDHFFRGEEAPLCERTLRFLEPHMDSASCGDA